MAYQLWSDCYLNKNIQASAYVISSRLLPDRGIPVHATQRRLGAERAAQRSLEDGGCGGHGGDGHQAGSGVLLVESGPGKGKREIIGFIIVINLPA